mgnify:CR=1 FL=1
MTRNSSTLSNLELSEKLKKMLDKGFVLYSKNGIIKVAKLPEFGSLIITVQDGNPILEETRQKEKI